MSKEKQILQHIADGKSQRAIAKMLKVSRNTVSSVVAASIRSGKTLPELLQMEEPEVVRLLFPEKELIPVQVVPDYEWVHKELLKDGVTLHSLWDEYCDQCREAKKPPYMYSQFCKLYSDYVDQHRLTMHISHKPGDKLMVDWAGTRFSYYDADDDKEQVCYLFVATLPFSMLCYAEACTNMKQESWINAHVHMYSYFGGSTKLLVCDNLKTGVVKNKNHEDPVLNRSYEELAEHYNTAILPARVLAPKDKAAVEGSVGALTRRLASKFRNRRFFSLHELNKAIRKELDEFNSKPFQKKEGSRFSVYNEEELPFMKPLPGYRYEYATWKVATVQMNYHISFDKQNYSVPYAYVRKKVDVRSTDSVVEIYYQGTRICSHRRLHGRIGQYATNIDHMPENHQLYSEWDSGRFKRWAESIGPHTREVVDKMFAAYRVEEQAYKGCLSLLKLADKYSSSRLENACAVALVHIPSPRYKNIRLILEAGQDLPKEDSPKEESDSVNKYTHLRGASYYGGGRNE